MPVDLQVRVSFQNNLGVVFGSAIWLSGDLIALEVDTRTHPEDRAELRVERKGQPETVHGWVTVLHVTEREGHPPLVVCQFNEISDGDRTILERWLRAVTGDGQGRFPESPRGDVPGAPPDTARERERALRRFDERQNSHLRPKTRGEERARALMGSEAAGPLGLVAEGSAAPMSGAPRQEALRRGRHRERAYTPHSSHRRHAY